MTDRDKIYLLSSYVGMFAIVCILLSSLIIYIVPKMIQMNHTAKKIISTIESLDEQCNNMNHLIRLNKNELVERYKADIKTAKINGKLYAVIDYDYDKGIREMEKRYKQINSFKVKY